MKMDRLSAMPHWPVRMTSDVACLFMCMSESAFLSRYGTLSYREEGNRYWSTAALEREVARQAGVPTATPSAGEVDRTWDDLR